MGRQHKLQIAMITLIVLLAVGVSALCGVLAYGKIAGESSANASDASVENVISRSGGGSSEQSSGSGLSGSATIELYAGQAEENSPFSVGNMLPGDSEAKSFRVRVAHQGKVTVHCKAVVRDGYEKLAEVMKARVALPDTGEVVYDGLMRDMPDSVARELDSSSRVTDELRYEITAYLETSVGNEYQNLDLIADITWWVDEASNLAPLAKTGDGTDYLLWICLAAACAAAVALVASFMRRKGMAVTADGTGAIAADGASASANPIAATAQTESAAQAAAPGRADTARKLKASVAIVVALSLCLCATTLALVLSAVSVRDNLFRTGEAGIDLNGGEPVIQESEFSFEPGMTVVKDFYVENEGTWDEYWRVYLDDVSGGLADVLEISISDGEDVLWSGSASALTRENAAAAGDTLKVGERRDLTMTFHYPEAAGNEGQGSGLSFTVRADAVQAKNNPDGLFG